MAADTSRSVAPTLGAATGPAELEAFCLREYPRLVAGLHLVCGDHQVAEDLAQETLVRVWDRWSRVQGLRSPGGWAHRVAMNLARSHLRRRGAEHRANLRSRPAVSAQSDPEVGERMTMEDALGALTVRQRQVIVLRYYLGHSVAETADVLGVSSGSVRSLTLRAITELRRSFAELNITEGEVR